MVRIFLYYSASLRRRQVRQENFGWVIFIAAKSRNNLFLFSSGYSLLPWHDASSIPSLELNTSLALTGLAVLLLPIFLTSAAFKVRKFKDFS